MTFLWEKREAIGRLMRLEKQYGTLLLLFPTLWSLFVASEGKPTLKHLAVFILGSFFMRSAGCVMNDMADHRLDARVERTKGRPLAANALTMREALIVLALLLGFSLFLVLMLNPFTLLLSFVALFTALFYPFAKRFTHLPQMILGVAFSWGIILAWTAVRNELAWTPFLLLLANLFWATGYDTVYAMMDLEDDLQVGIKSTAVLFGPQSWMAVGFFHALVIFFMTWVGVRLKMGSIYYLALLGVALFFLFQSIQLRRRLPKSTLFLLFRSHVWAGMIILIGITLNYHLKI